MRSCRCHSTLTALRGHPSEKGHGTRCSACRFTALATREGARTACCPSSWDDAKLQQRRAAERAARKPGAWRLGPHDVVVVGWRLGRLRMEKFQLWWWRTPMARRPWPRTTRMERREQEKKTKTSARWTRRPARTTPDTRPKMSKQSHSSAS